MDAVLMLATAVAGWAFAVFITIESRKDERQLKADHAQEMERAGVSIQQLLDQVQLNAQSMPYYPQVGPFPSSPEPERNYLSDPSGLFVVDEAQLAEAFDEVER